MNEMCFFSQILDHQGQVSEGIESSNATNGVDTNVLGSKEEEVKEAGPLGDQVAEVAGTEQEGWIKELHVVPVS